MTQRFFIAVFAAATLLTNGFALAENSEGASAQTAPPAPVAATAPANAAPALPPAPAAPALNAPLSNPTAPTTDLGSSLLQLAFGFLVVMALLFGCLWVLKRLQAPSTRSAGLMKVIATLPMGTRERAVLIEAGGQWLLVGMGPNYMVKLADLPRQDLPTTPTGPAAPDFAAWFKRALERRKDGSADA